MLGVFQKEVTELGCSISAIQGDMLSRNEGETAMAELATSEAKAT